MTNGKNDLLGPLLKRFDMVCDGFGGVDFDEDPHGMWVDFDDVAELVQRLDSAIELAVRYGGIDGDHHKAWVIDQIVRALAGNRYSAIVADAQDGDDGPETYTWDEGIAP